VALMRDAPRSPLLRLLLLAAVFAVALVSPRSARAAGTATFKEREVTEVDGRWKFFMTIDYGSIPPLPHIPMIFSFEPKVLYERALTDQSPTNPVLVKKPLQNQPTINESLDVGFSDASGKIFKVTKFDFSLRRDRGYEAGEYDLKIRRQDDGAQVGQVIRVTLKGDNPVVDRRAMVFSGEKKKDKSDKPAADADKKQADAPKSDEPAKADAPAAPTGDAPAPPPVEPKQGGCGCRVVGENGPGSLGALALIALGAAVAARRSSRSRVRAIEPRARV
jgi:MYXO-CTERM domain-containing protein